MPAKKIRIQWLLSDSPNDIDKNWKPQLWPVRKLIGNVQTGAVCHTTQAGKRWPVLVLGPGNTQAPDEHNERFAEVGAPPCSALPSLEAPGPKKQVSDDKDKDPDYVPEEDVSSGEEDIEEDGKSAEVGETSGSTKAGDLVSEAAKESGEGGSTGAAGSTEEAEESSSEGQRQMRVSKPDQWKKNIRKRKFLLGEAHVNTRGKEVPAKAPKSISRHSASCKLKCNQITEQQRLSLCQNYWQMGDRKQQKVWLLNNIFEEDVKTHVARVAEKEVSCRRHYSFPVAGEQLAVCRQFFCDTLCISYNTVIGAFKHSTDHRSYSHEDQRGKHKPGHALSEVELEFLRNHIKLLPKQESHYCRSQTKRKYILGFNSIAEVWRSYTEACNQVEPPVRFPELPTFKKYFCSEFNLGFWKPKKDSCAKCEVLNGKDDPESKASLAEHLKQKENCRKQKDLTKKEAEENKDVEMVTMDLESVLSLPHSNVSSFYYSRKLCVYNFTILDGSTRQGTCFFWSELDGGRGSSEISTCVFEYLKSLGEKRVVYFWSDTCGGQNRNQNIAALMIRAVQIFPIQEIYLNYLESGHTHMECDNMHSSIERSAKLSKVFSMEEWENVMRRSRIAKPFHIRRMKYADFINSKAIAAEVVTNRKRNSDNEVVNWLKIKSLKFEKDKPNLIQYKTDHFSEEFKSIVLSPLRGRPPTVENLPMLYTSEQTIGKAKKSDLEKLCDKNLIPALYQPFFRSLKATARVRDDEVELSEGEISEGEEEERKFENSSEGEEVSDEESVEECEEGTSNSEDDVPLAQFTKEF